MMIGYSQVPYKEGVTPVLDHVANVNNPVNGGNTISDLSTPGTVQSVQHGGEWQTRPADAAGDFEVFFGITPGGCLMAICPSKDGIGGNPPTTYVYPYRVIG